MLSTFFLTAALPGCAGNEKYQPLQLRDGALIDRRISPAARGLYNSLGEGEHTIRIGGCEYRVRGGINGNGEPELMIIKDGKATNHLSREQLTASIDPRENIRKTDLLTVMYTIIQGRLNGHEYSTHTGSFQIEP